MLSLGRYLDLYILIGLEAMTRPSASVRSRSMVYDQQGAFSVGEDFVLPQRHALRQDIVEALDRLSDVMANAVYDYLVLACMGEARHASSHHVGMYISEIPATSSRSAVYKAGPAYNPKQAMPLIVDLFDRPWGGSFGGKKWANIAESAMMYGKETNIMFLDHCADLHHNTGTVFNKTSTAEVTGFKLDIDVMPILNWKLNSNVVVPPSSMHSMYNRYNPSFVVANLLARYYAAWHGQIVDKRIYNRAESTDWEYKPVSWGKLPMTLIYSKGNGQSKPETVVKETYDAYNLLV